MTTDIDALIVSLQAECVYMQGVGHGMAADRLHQAAAALRELQAENARLTGAMGAALEITARAEAGRDALQELRAENKRLEKARNLAQGTAARNHIYLMNCEEIADDPEYDYYGDYELPVHDKIKVLHQRAERAEDELNKLRKVQK